MSSIFPYNLGWLFTGLATLIITASPVVTAETEVFTAYKYDAERDKMQITVQGVPLQKVIEAIAVKQQIKLEISDLSAKLVTGTYSGKTDRVVKNLLQSDNLVLTYKFDEKSNIHRVSGIKTLTKGTQDSNFLSKESRNSSIKGDDEHKARKEEKRQRREYRHSMGLGRINNHIGEPEMLNKHK